MRLSVLPVSLGWVWARLGGPGIAVECSVPWLQPPSRAPAHLLCTRRALAAVTRHPPYLPGDRVRHRVLVANAERWHPRPQPGGAPTLGTRGVFIARLLGSV